MKRRKTSSERTKKSTRFYLALVIFCLTFLWAIRAGLPRKTLVLSGLFALAGLCANFMPIAASYYPERCMCTTVLLLVMAVVMLSAELMKAKGFPVIAACTAFLILLTIPQGLRGCRDIVSCHRQNAQREQTIAAALEAGEGSSHGILRLEKDETHG